MVLLRRVFKLKDAVIRLEFDKSLLKFAAVAHSNGVVVAYCNRDFMPFSDIDMVREFYAEYETLYGSAPEPETVVVVTPQSMHIFMGSDYADKFFDYLERLARDEEAFLSFGFCIGMPQEEVMRSEYSIYFT